MQTGPTFQVGNQQVDRRQVDPALIARMAESAKGIKVDGNPDAESWTALADRVTKADAVSTADLEQLQGLGKACFSYHKKLHVDFKNSGYKDETIKAELADVHVFTDGNDKIREALMLASAKTAVAAAVGGTFGPVGLLTAYTAYAKLPAAALQELAGTLQEIRDGRSHTYFQGNHTEAVHRQEIWPRMIELLDGAAQAGRAGKPTQVTAQYYELTNQQIVGKLAEAAEAGNKVRVNVDAGRLVAFKGDHVEIDEVPDKLRSILQLSQVKGDIGVSFYPVASKLGDPGDLMHRKGLGVGDKFLLTGMNANEGSGENVDAGVVIQGPAAHQLGLNFARDCHDSAGASNADIYGEKPLAEFMQADINMGARGLVAMFDCANGPSKAGTALPRATSYAQLETIAASHGQKLTDYIDVPAARVDEMLSQGEQVPLSAEGKKRFLALVDRTLDATRTPTNLKRLADIPAPADKAAGKTTVAIADIPSEREAIFLTAIQEAEKFVYVPAFVMTRSVASMLVARRDELKAEGKDLDIRVIADPGIYPDGGTPNEAGVEFLEDHQVPVRWAMLPRGGQHDRKIHAKEILTDKGEVCGSTNFSNKGLRENWEHSGYVKFDESDASSMAHRDKAVGHFLDLWNHESYELNTLEKGKQLRWRARDEKDYLVQADEARYGVTRDILQGVEAFEKATGAFVTEQAKTVGPRIEELLAQGHDKDTATLMAVQEKMGPDGFYQALRGLPESQALDDLKTGNGRRRAPRRS